MRTRIALLLAVLLLMTLGSAATAQDVSLEMWIAASPEELEAVEAQVQLFRDANPGITVTVSAQPEYDTQLQTAFAAGDYPDVFYVGQGKFVEYVEAGVLYNGNDMIENPDGLYPALRNTFTYDGSLYCPAKDFSTLAIQYNRDMFDAAGLDYPTADWTWDDLRAAAIALTNENQVGLIANADLDRWYAFYVQAGGHLYDEEGNFIFEADPALQALQLYADLHQGGYAATSADLGAGWPGEAFGQGKGAMTLEGNWIISYLLNNFPELNWGAAEMPIGPGSAMSEEMGEMAGRGTLTFTVCLAVGANTEFPTEAWSLVNFLTGEEGAALVAETGFGPMPSRPSAAQLYIDSFTMRAEGTGLDASTLTAFTEGGNYAVAPIMPPGFQPFRDELNQGIQAVIDGTDTAEAVVENVAGVAQELIEEAGG
ncbi:MAG: sugar ABC transporter substrate-binding protein [Chloroflexi bacterium]|nr:sugar ABC transporter substrate-binding protein [Chloroflexota bacterium]